MAAPKRSRPLVPGVPSSQAPSYDEPLTSILGAIIRLRFWGAEAADALAGWEAEA